MRAGKKDCGHFRMGDTTIDYIEHREIDYKAKHINIII